MYKNIQTVFVPGSNEPFTTFFICNRQFTEADVFTQPKCNRIHLKYNKYATIFI